MPLVSVLLPYRDEETHLEDALASLRAQTLDDFQVLMVDDGSTDGSPSIAGSYAGTDSRFRSLRSPGRGIVDALNHALMEAEAPWAARMDADDISLPGRLERQLDMARAAGPSTVVSCLVRSFPRAAVTAGFSEYERWVNGLTEPEELERGLFVESPIPHPTAFFHRESILAAGGYIEKELPEDYELWLRLWRDGFRFMKVPDTLLHWRERPDRLSRTSPAYSLSSFYRLKARYLRWTPCLRRSGGRFVIAGSGQTARRLSKYLIEEGMDVVAFTGPDEKDGERLLRGRPVVSPERGLEYSLPFLVAVRLPGARDRVTEFLRCHGLHDWEDFVVCS